MDIIFEQANFQKSDYPVLRDINITLEGGKSYAIMGGMASGKSSFLEAIGGKLFPVQGKVFRPRNIELVPGDYSFHKYIGEAFQYYQQRYHAYDSEIGPTLYEVLQNQLVPLGTVDMTSVELPPMPYEAHHVAEVCAQFRVEHLLHHKVTTLSTGETRRALLARSILKEPSWLLLDDPFSGLDKESRSLLKEILGSLHEKGVNIILVCGLNDIPDFIDHVIILKEGEVIHTSNDLDQDMISKYIPQQELDSQLLSQLLEKQDLEFESFVTLKKAIVTYGGIPAIKDFYWEVKKGERWALMGPNGSGKSTILSLITADNPQAYRNEMYLFDKKRGSGESIWDIKKKIGYVSSELQAYFDKGTPVWEVVASGLFDTQGLFQRLPDPLLVKVFDYLKLLNILDIAERRIDQVSKGQARLAFLGRALVKAPPVLILDEPCQGLDYSQMMHFRNLLDTIVPAFDMTMIYVTHYEEEIPRCVNYRLDINKGEAVRKIERK